MTSDTQLRDRMRDVPDFVGVFEADRLPERLEPGQTLIANCDNAGMPGSHWIAMARKHDGQPLFFCPYGLAPDKQDPYLPIAHKTYFRNYLERFGKISSNNDDFEGLRADTCGEWSCLFLLCLHELVPTRWSIDAIEMIHPNLKNMAPTARDAAVVDLVGIRSANNIPSMISARRRGHERTQSMPMAMHAAH